MRAGSRIGGVLGLGLGGAVAAWFVPPSSGAAVPIRASDAVAQAPAPSDGPAVAPASEGSKSCCKQHGAADEKHQCPHEKPRAAATKCPYLSRSTAGAATAGRARDKADLKGAYACPMHPEVTSGQRGRCPKCGMFLERP